MTAWGAHALLTVKPGYGLGFICLSRGVLMCHSQRRIIRVPELYLGCWTQSCHLFYGPLFTVFSEGARVRRGHFGDGEDNAVVSESSRDLR